MEEHSLCFLFYIFKEKALVERRDGVLSDGCFLAADGYETSSVQRGDAREGPWAVRMRACMFLKELLDV